MKRLIVTLICLFTMITSVKADHLAVEFHNTTVDNGSALLKGFRTAFNIRILNQDTEALPAGTKVHLFSYTTDSPDPAEVFPQATLNGDIQPGQRIRFISSGSEIPISFNSVNANNTGTFEMCYFIFVDDDPIPHSDTSCLTYNLYEGTRDIGVSAITQPTDGETLALGSAFETRISLTNFDSIIPVLQSIPIRIQLGANNVQNFNLNTSTNWAAGNTINLNPIQINVPSAMPPGDYDLCAWTEWNLDDNPANDETCIQVTVQGQTSLKNPDGLQSGITAYPNPASSHTAFKPGTPFTQPGSLILSDLSGRTVIEATYKKGDEVIDLNVENLKPGVYLYKLSDQKESFNGRLVIE